MGVVHNISVAHICRVPRPTMGVRWCGVHVVDKGKYENNICMKRRIASTVCSAFAVCAGLCAAEWVVRVNTILFARIRYSAPVASVLAKPFWHGISLCLCLCVCKLLYARFYPWRTDCVLCTVQCALSACHLWKFNSWKPSDVSRRVPLSLAIYLFLSFIIILNHCYYYCVCCCWFRCANNTRQPPPPVHLCIRRIDDFEREWDQNSNSGGKQSHALLRRNRKK